MIIMNSSCDPTSATTGHAAAAAPARPCATFAASVAAIPRPSSDRANPGNGTLRRAESRSTHRTRVNQPVHRERNQTCRPARFHVRSDQRVGVLIGRDGRDPPTPITAAAVIHLMPPSASITGYRRQLRTPWPGCIGFLVQSIRAQKPPAAPEDLPSATRLTCADRRIGSQADR